MVWNLLYSGCGRVTEESGGDLMSYLYEWVQKILAVLFPFRRPEPVRVTIKDETYEDVVAAARRNARR